MRIAAEWPDALTRVVRAHEARPEWWCVAIGATAWGVMIPHAVAHAGHTHHVLRFEQELASWLLMVVAMMLPLVGDQVRFVAFKSYRFRRHRAIAGFLVGYLLVWGLAGVPVAALRGTLWARDPFVVAGAFGAAALWALLPMVRSAHAAHHRTAPLVPTGWRADLSSFGHGVTISVPCVVTCWPLMIACALTGHSAIAMVGGAAIGWVQRRAFWPRPRFVAVATVIIGGVHGLVSLP